MIARRRRPRLAAPPSILFATVLVFGQSDCQVASTAVADGRRAATATRAQSRPSAEDAVVEWVDAKTGKVLFTSRDIVRFDWDRQLFELKREQAMDLLSLPPALRRDFVVRDAEGDIYRGCFMSGLSSSSYDGPTIKADLFVDTSPPLYHIAGGYPGKQGPGARVRFNPRLKNRLEAAGLLARINKDDVAPIEAVFSGWHGDALGCRASIAFFPETVRLGRDIRFVLRFAANRSSTSPPAEREARGRQGLRNNLAFSPEPDQVEARVTLKSGDSDARRTRTVPISMENLAEDSASPFTLWPWSETGRSVDARFKPGPAELTVFIVATRKTDKGFEQVGVWEFPPRQVKILPGSQ